MIGIELLVTQLSGLQREDLERWIINEWVRPDRRGGQFEFHDIDVARVRLIQELHYDMQVNDDALPIVLSLLDQLYELRRRMRELNAALGSSVPEELRKTLAAMLAKPVR